MSTSPRNMQQQLPGDPVYIDLRHTRRVYRIDDDGYELDAMCAEDVHSLRTRRAGTR